MGKLIVLLLNSFFPDPIPVIDELIMLVGLAYNVNMVVNIKDFVEEHKILSILILILVVVGIIFLWNVVTN